jgi:hypothetical protein
VKEAIARGCREAPKDADEAFIKARREALGRAIECFSPLVREKKTNGGTFAAEFALTPEGDVIGARVNRATLPHEEAQACALAVLRGMRFPPPIAEDAGKTQGFGFELMPR